MVPIQRPQRNDSAGGQSVDKNEIYENFFLDSLNIRIDLPKAVGHGIRPVCVSVLSDSVVEFSLPTMFARCLFIRRKYRFSIRCLDYYYNVLVELVYGYSLASEESHYSLATKLWLLI